MILADKIIKLRKKNGWSQEELAEKMNVSRQAVSKWEGAQAVPDLDKILQLADLFDVTTDYLLKDEIEAEAVPHEVPISGIKRVSLQEATDYIEQRKWASWKIALATFLCILSPIALLILGAASEINKYRISENIAVTGGLGILFVIVTIAVAIFVYCGFKSAPYEFLEGKEPFQLEHGVNGMIKEKQNAFRNTYILYNVIATCICVLSPLPLVIAALTEKEFLTVIMLTVTMAVAGIGVFLFIVAGVQWASMQKLLKEGEFSQRRSSKNKIQAAIQEVYWIIVTAAYLGWSFLTNDWHFTWIIWPIAAILSGIITTICEACAKKE